MNYSAQLVKTVQVLMDVLNITKTHENKIAVQSQLELGISTLRSQLKSASLLKAEHNIKGYLGSRIDFREEVIVAVIDVYFHQKVPTVNQKNLLAANGIYL
ncbi:hypothetical protein OAL32_00360 [Synechococcus sp. AH-551-G15]|nr:hypothetical protein [Synechococcus sp. AH-551-G15]